MENTVYVLLIIIGFCTLGKSDVTNPCKSPPNLKSKVAIDMYRAVDIQFLRSVSVHFCRSHSVVLQLWRPLHNNTEYMLEWRKELFPPLQVPQTISVLLDNREQRALDPAYRYYVGLYIGDDVALPVATYFAPQSGRVIFSQTSALNYTEGERYSFYEPVYPFKYRVGICDTPICELPPTPTDDPTTTEKAAPTEVSLSSSTEGSTSEPVRVLVGPPGPPGVPGLVGEPGLPGPPGEPGPVKTELEKGPAGDMGKVGASGQNGINGKSGVNGKQGLPGPPGKRGKKGVQGLQGKAAAATDQCECSGFLRPATILGLIIWSLILTFVLFLLLCVFAWTVSAERKLEQQEKDLATFVYAQ